MLQPTHGFTLLELLIAIAIIGILAATLIPNLLGARRAADEKAAQTYAANTYHTAFAWLADGTYRKASDLPANCGVAAELPPSSGFGWSDKPAMITSCTITPKADGSFDVTVATVRGKTFVNGLPQ